MAIGKTLRKGGSRLLEIDRAAHELVEPYACSLPVRALDPMAKAGDQPEVRTIAGLIIAAGTFAASDRLVRAGARMMIAHEAATAVKTAIKRNIDRRRPRSASKGAEKPRKGDHRAKELSSFPSGHSAGGIAAARAFSREFPALAPAALAAAGAIAAVQVVRRAHYPTDVAAGLAIGLAAEAVMAFLWRIAEMDRRSRE